MSATASPADGVEDVLRAARTACRELGLQWARGERQPIHVDPFSVVEAIDRLLGPEAREQYSIQGGS